MSSKLRHFVLASLMFSCGPGFAHHSPAEYDTSRELTVTGTVVSFEWVNPHTLTTIRVEDTEGTAVDWTLEGMSPAHLGRLGWSRHTLGAGDVIEAVFFPDKSGDRKGLFLRATLPDGTLKVMATDPAQRRP
jgi:hypothetical protein